MTLSCWYTFDGLYMFFIKKLLRKRIELSMDVALILVLVFAISFGFILYQKFQYSSLLETYINTQWSLQNEEVNVQYFKGLYEKCMDSADWIWPDEQPNPKQIENFIPIEPKSSSLILNRFRYLSAKTGSFLLCGLFGDSYCSNLARILVFAKHRV